MSITNTTESMYAALENAGVWVQIDRSGVGHNWVDVDDDELRYDVIEALTSTKGNLNAGAYTEFGGVLYCLRACDFE